MQVCSAGTTSVCVAFFLNKTVSILPNLSVQSTTVALGVSCISRVICCPARKRGLPLVALQAAWPLGPLVESVETRNLQW